MEIMSFADIMNLPVFDKTKEYKFGDWVYDPKTETVEYTPNQYWFDATSITNSAQMLDWIFQIYRKGWGKDCIADLLEMMNWIYAPQSSFCSYGKDKTTKWKDR